MQVDFIKMSMIVRDNSWKITGGGGGHFIGHGWYF